MARFRKGEFIAKVRVIGYPTREIAEMLYNAGVLLYGVDNERSQRRVWAHISKFKKILRTMRRMKMMGDASHDL